MKVDHGTFSHMEGNQSLPGGSGTWGGGRGQKRRFQGEAGLHGPLVTTGRCGKQPVNLEDALPQGDPVMPTSP